MKVVKNYLERTFKASFAQIEDDLKGIMVDEVYKWELNKMN